MIKFTNNAYSTLAVGISDADLSITVATGHGDRFPEVTGTDICYVTLENTGGIREIVKVTARAPASNTMTIVRAQDNTTAVAWLAGVRVGLRVIAGELDRFESLENVDAADSKTTPVDADYLPLKDSAASNGLKRLTWANIKATLKTYFDTLYADVGAITGGGITMATARLLGRSTAATGAVEEITVGTGMELAAGALNCTVTSDVTSVGGYTGAVTAGNLRTALLTVDGAGSEVDADRLDGQEGAYYATAASVATKAGVDIGNLGVGMIALCYTAGVYAAGATTAGSNLVIGNLYGYGSMVNYGSVVPSGTWRNISGIASVTADVMTPTHYYLYFQRIA
jgi:hypothetical protein